MVDYTRKQPFTQNLLGAVDWRIKTAMSQNGYKLPCSVVSAQNNVVTIKFEMDVGIPMVLPDITIPVFGPEYIRYPLKNGDLGFTISADVYLGAISQIGGGSAPNMSNYGNLSSVLVFMPISSTKWSVVSDPNSLILYGPNGVIIRDVESKSVVTINKDSGITLQASDSTVVTVNKDSGVTLEVGDSKIAVTSGGVSITGALTINGSAYLSHKHNGVQPGSGTSGGVVP